MSLARCYSCDKHISSKAESCPHCKAHKQISCYECDTKIDIIRKFCPNCGAPKSGIRTSIKKYVSSEGHLWEFFRFIPFIIIFSFSINILIVEAFPEIPGVYLTKAQKQNPMILYWPILPYTMIFLILFFSFIFGAKFYLDRFNKFKIKTSWLILEGENQERYMQRLAPFNFLELLKGFLVIFLLEAILVLFFMNSIGIVFLWIAEMAFTDTHLGFLGITIVISPILSIIRNKKLIKVLNNRLTNN